jgi:hypothetical protein
MAKRLNPEDLKIETFVTGTAKLYPGAEKCTGCPSGCGIIASIEPMVIGNE